MFIPVELIQPNSVEYVLKAKLWPCDISPAPFSTLTLKSLRAFLKCASNLCKINIIVFSKLCLDDSDFHVCLTFCTTLFQKCISQCDSDLWWKRYPCSMQWEIHQVLKTWFFKCQMTEYLSNLNLNLAKNSKFWRLKLWFRYQTLSFWIQIA